MGFSLESRQSGGLADASSPLAGEAGVKGSEPEESGVRKGCCKAERGGEHAWEAVSSRSKMIMHD